MTSREQPLEPSGEQGNLPRGRACIPVLSGCCKKAADQDEGSPPEGRKPGLCDFQKTSRWLVPSLGALACERHRRTQDSTPDAAERRARRRRRGRHRQGIDDLRGWLELTGFSWHGIARHARHGMAWHRQQGMAIGLGLRNSVGRR